MNVTNFEYFHGSLNYKSIDEIHTDNKKLEKFIAGHRIQYKPTDKFKFSISEIVVYGNRSPELGYLNPISFFWAQEHNLGDLDNILLSLIKTPTINLLIFNGSFAPRAFD